MRGNAELIAKIAALEKRLDDLVKPEKGWTPHFLTEPLTNTDFDGDSFSDVAALTKIENTSWSTTIPADAKALLIRILCRDSGSAATTNLYVSLFGAAAAVYPSLAARPSSLTNNDYAEASGIVPCTDGDIWYTINASAASTMDVWLQCFGWWT